MCVLQSLQRENLKAVISFVRVGFREGRKQEGISCSDNLPVVRYHTWLDQILDSMPESMSLR